MDSSTANAITQRLGSADVMGTTLDEIGCDIDGPDRVIRKKNGRYVDKTRAKSNCGQVVELLEI